MGGLNKFALLLFIGFCPFDRKTKNKSTSKCANNKCRFVAWKELANEWPSQIISAGTLFSVWNARTVDYRSVLYGRLARTQTNQPVRAYRWSMQTIRAGCARSRHSFQSYIQRLCCYNKTYNIGNQNECWKRRMQSAELNLNTIFIYFMPNKKPYEIVFYDLI